MAMASSPLYLSVASTASSVDAAALACSDSLTSLSLLRLVKDVEDNSSHHYLETYVRVSASVSSPFTNVSTQSLPAKLIIYEQSENLTVTGYNSSISNKAPSTTNSSSYFEIVDRKSGSIRRIDNSSYHGALMTGWFGGCALLRTDR
jgi:hypothetical protein